MPHDPDVKAPYEEVLTAAAARARNYLQTIRERHVGVAQEALEKLPSLGGPMPAHGQGPRKSDRSRPWSLRGRPLDNLPRTVIFSMTLPKTTRVEIR